MVVQKQRVATCNKTLMSSDYWGPETGTYSLKTLNVTDPQLRNEALLGQAILHCALLDMLLLLALCITLCWRFGCRFWGWFWDSNMRRDASIIHQISGQRQLSVEDMPKSHTPLSAFAHTTSTTSAKLLHRVRTACILHTEAGILPQEYLSPT